MIYFDNSASTMIKPKEVISAVSSGLTKYSANPGRSGHDLSLACAIKISEVREKVTSFLGVNKSERVIFTSGCTEAINLALQGCLLPNSHIITTINAHNAVLRTIFALKEKINLEISIAKPKNKDRITVDDIAPLIKSNTQMICVNQISNVDGMRVDIDEIGELCARKCLIFCVDGAQSVGHTKIDFSKQNIDLLAVAPHKGLYAPQGVGCLCVSQKCHLSPIKFGGTGTESFSVLQPTTFPEGFESGTVATPNILGLGEGVNFVSKNYSLIIKKTEDLSTYLNFELRQIDGLKVYTEPENDFGVIAFNIKDASSTDVSDLLSKKYNICTRSGLHCAPLKHDFLGTTKQGAVRASLSVFNTFSECEKFIKIIKNISKEF